MINTTINEKFHSLLEITSPTHDHEAARKFGLENWASLDEKARFFWDWVYGKENRVRKFAKTPRHIERKLAIAEDRHAGFDGPFAGTL